MRGTAPPLPRAPGPAHRRRRSAGRRWPRRLAIGSVLLVALLILVAAGGYFYTRYRYDQVRKLNVGGLAVQGSGQPMNILLVGDNCRSCLNGQQANAFGTGSEVGGGRSDVLMVLHLDPNARSVSLLSIPRDTWLPVPGGNSELRVDDALNQGPTSLVRTVSQDLGIPINHFVVLNFDSFQSVVTDLGGLNMYFPDPVYDAYSALNVPTPGCHALNGFQALAVVRARHMYYEKNGTWSYDGNGDLSRIARDHEFLRVLASSVSQRGLGNPVTDNSLLSSVTPGVEFDKGLSLSDMVNLLLSYHSVDPNSIPQYTLPVQVDSSQAGYVYQGANYGSVVFPVWPQDQQVIDQFLGAPAPAGPSPASVSVQVLNGSGAYDQATETSSALAAYGYQIAGAGDTTVVGQPDETVVRYAPGQLPAAQALAQHLTGNVGMSQANLAAGTDVQVVTGTYLSVTPPPTPGSVTPSTAAQGGSSETGSSAGAAATTSTGPAGNLDSPTAARSSLPDYDPRACPAGAQAAPLASSLPAPTDLPAE